MKTLPEYENNPYISRLPALVGPTAIGEDLAKPPSWDSEERQLSPTLRRHCVHRLKDAFFPGNRAVMFADDFGMLLRRGYVGRDPSRRGHESRALRVADQARDGVLLSAGSTVLYANNADSSLLSGIPGMGKTLTVKEVLGTYPQVIEHADMPAQIVYLRLDTPVKGSLRGLCVDFFVQVDALLGQETYTRLYAGQHATEESMMSNMALVANYHALGCLVIDEIQHLQLDATGKMRVVRSDEPEPDLMRFMVTLTNKMGVPVLFVGTRDAGDLFERTASMARRSVGNFGGVWLNFKADSKEWAAFLDDLWQYQWTRSVMPLTPELRAVMHDETQGVVDLAVKLLMRTQIRLILRSDANPAFPEQIDAHFVRSVAKSDFVPVKGFLHALRVGDPALMANYRDLTQFNKAFREETKALVGETATRISKPRRRDTHADRVEVEPDFVELSVRHDLKRLGVKADLIDDVIAMAREEVGDDPTTEALLKAAKRALKPGRSKDAPTPRQEERLVDGDLRTLARKALAEGRKVHEALAAAGIGGTAALSLAA